MVNLHCSVRGCKRRRGSPPGLKLYTFPKNKEFHDVWSAFCYSRKAISKTSTICSAHFEEKYKVKSALDLAYNLSPKRTRDLSADAIPTLHGPYPLPETLIKVETETLKSNSISHESMNVDLPDQPVVEPNPSICNKPECSSRPYALVMNECQNLSPDDFVGNLEEENAKLRADAERWSSEHKKLCKENSRLLERTEVVMKEKEEIYNPLKRLATDKTQQCQWKSLREVNESLALEKVMQQSVKLKAIFTKLQKDYENMAERNKKAEGEILGLRKMVNKLREYQQTLKMENEQLAHEKDRLTDMNDKYEGILKKYFSPGQLKRLLSDKSNRRL